MYIRATTANLLATVRDSVECAHLDFAPRSLVTCKSRDLSRESRNFESRTSEIRGNSRFFLTSAAKLAESVALAVSRCRRAKSGYVPDRAVKFVC